MKQQTAQTWQHSPQKIQGIKSPVKEVKNSLKQSSFTSEDLLGLSWTLFEENVI